MPRRRKRDPVWVLTPGRIGGTNIHYGFQTSALDSDGSELGHVPYTGNESFIVWFGANAPKPPRYSKQKATGVVNYFCGIDSIAAAVAAGWSEAEAGYAAAPGTTTKSTLVGVDMGNGEYYAWNMNTADFGDRGAPLGIEVITGTNEIIMGARSPKPVRVQRTVGDPTTDESFTETGFMKPGQDPPAGWKVVRGTGKGLERLPGTP